MRLIQDLLSAFFGLGPAMADIAIALACGFLISLLYRWSHRGPSYSITFANSLPPLAMITSLVIMVIGNNLARAFGLVGALSIIRFRTAIKDTQDIVFIFFSLAVGMAAGVGLHSTVLAGTLFIGASILLLSRFSPIWSRRREFLLRFRIESSKDQEPAIADVADARASAAHSLILKKYCKQHKLVNVQALEDGDFLELFYYINLKNEDESQVFVRQLGRLPRVSHVNLFFEEEQL